MSRALINLANVSVLALMNKLQHVRIYMNEHNNMQLLPIQFGRGHVSELLPNDRLTLHYRLHASA